MLFQKKVTDRPTKPTPTQGDFQPREDVDYNHDPDHDHDHSHAHSHAHGD
jgi:hypothetical protein